MKEDIFKKIEPNEALKKAAEKYKKGKDMSKLNQIKIPVDINPIIGSWLENQMD